MNGKQFLRKIDELDQKRKVPQTGAEFLARLPRNAEDAWRNTPQGMDETDGVAGLPGWTKDVVRAVDKRFGKGAGDAARFVAKLPETFTGGVGSGVMSASGGAYQALNDLTGDTFGTGYLGKMAQSQHQEAARLRQGAAADYRTAWGRLFGQGVNSFGESAPLVVAAAVTRNPNVMSVGMGAQTGLSEYGEAREAGLSPAAAAPYAGGQAALEVLTEAVPSKLLIGQARPRGMAGVAAYGVAEGAGEQAATHSQDFVHSAVVDSRSNPDWLQTYGAGRKDAALETVAASLVQGAGNPALVRSAEKGRDALSRLFFPQNGAAPVQAASPPAAPVLPPQAVQSGTAAQRTAAKVRQAAGGTMRTRNDIPMPRVTSNPRNRADLAALAQHPNVQKILGLISYTEGTQTHGYQTMVGGGRFGDLSRHPNKVGLRTKDGPSTAAGRYQITGTTWRGLQKQYGFTDFSPQAQDEAAVALLSNRGALNDVLRGDYRSAINKLGKEWVSLPSSTNTNQGKRSWEKVERYLGISPTSAFGGGAVKTTHKGLRLKNKEAIAGGVAEGGLYGVAHWFQDNLGADLQYFSAFNDAYHHSEGYFAKKGNRNSGAHGAGLAMDIVLKNPAKSKQAVAALHAHLAERGLKQGTDYTIIDEYANPSKGATGGHLDFRFKSKAAAQRYAQGGQAVSGSLNADSPMDGSLLAADNSLLGDDGDTGADLLRPEFAPDDGQAEQNDAADWDGVRDNVAQLGEAVARQGKETKVWLGNQMRQARLRLADADELRPDLAGTDNQYRDRNRAASQVQVNQIAQNLQPELLGDSYDVGTGAPTLADDGKTVIGGNGRIMALAQAYADGKAEHYRDWLAQNAQAFGLNADEVRAMGKPVLVRELAEKVDIAKAAVASNEGGGLGMSSLEQARADADRLPDLGTLMPDDEGELNTAANRAFIREFVRQMPVNAQAQMVDAYGMLSQDGSRRLRNALLYRAYGNSAALSRMVESTDQGARNMVNAMVRAAPRIAKAREYIRDGAMHDADIAADLVAAVETLNRLREQGVSVQDYLAQQSFLSDGLNDVQRDLLAFLEQNKRSAKAVFALLEDYYQLLEAQGSPAQDSMFGDAAPEKQDLLNRARGKDKENERQEQGFRQPETEDGGLFGTEQQQSPVESDEGDGKPESGGRDEGGISEAEGLNKDGSEDDYGIWGWSEEQRAAAARAKKALKELAQSKPDNAESLALGDEVAQRAKVVLSRVSEAVQKAVGADNMHHIRVVTREQAKSLLHKKHHAYLNRVNGWHRDGQVVLVADNLRSPAHAKVTAWHELGHRGIRVSGWQQWQRVLGELYFGNTTVKQIADAVRRERADTNDKAGHKKAAAAEEALVELYAAWKTARWGELEKRYSVKVSEEIRRGAGFFRRVADKLRQVLRQVLGLPVRTFDDAAVFGLLKRLESVEDWGMDGQAQPSFSMDKEEGAETGSKQQRQETKDSGSLKSWRNELGELSAGLAAYHALGDVIRPVLAKVKLANTHADSFTSYMRDYRAQVNVAGRTAKEIADEGVKMSAAERELLSDILERELPEGQNVPAELGDLAEAVRTVLTQQGKDLVALGMLSADSEARFRDTYLPRMYRKHTGLFDDSDLAKANRAFSRAVKAVGGKIDGSHLKGRGIFEIVPKARQTEYEKKGFELREDFGSKGKNAGKVMMWRDYTRQERTQMGEVRDAVLRFTSGYVKTQADIAKAMLFKRVAEDGELSSKAAVDGWVQVPESTVAGTGGVYRYGALAGIWVHPDVYYHLQQQFYIDNAVQKIWRKVLGWWKIGKTVYNPVAHVNNVVSNIAMAVSAGVRLADLPAAAVMLKKKNGLYDEALEQGLIGEAADAGGLMEMFVGLNGAENDGQVLESLVSRVLKRADKLSLQVTSKLGKGMQKAYRVEDEVFRLALYKMARDKGLKPREAADYALTFMFDYSEVPQGVKWLRDSGLLPFVSYTHKAIPAMARSALTRPHRVLAITSFFYGLNALSYALLGDAGDEEEERENMPEYQTGYTSFGTPKLIRLPWNDDKGKPVFLDVYRWLPLGDFADTQNRMGGLPVPQWMIPNGPAVGHAATLLFNKDTFTGNDVVKPYMDGGEKAAVYAKWLAAQWLPASVGVPYSYHTNNVMDGLKNEFEGTAFADVLEDMGYTGKTYRGEDKQLYRAGFGAFGVKLRGEKPDDLKAAKQRKLGYEVRELKADIGRIRKDNTLSESAREEKLANRREALARLMGKMPE